MIKSMNLDKIFLFIKVILNSGYESNLPKNIKLLIFDGESLNELQNVLNSFNYFVLETRFHRIKKFYVNKNIIFSIIKNIKKGLFNAYLLSLIDEVKPRVIFTFIDNSYKFTYFYSLRKKKYKFVALQNGARYEHKITNELLKRRKNLNFKKFRIPHFLCFGENEVKDYKKNNQDIKNFYKIGSLRLANYLLFKKKNKIKIKKKYDILLISDVYCWDEPIKKLNLPIEKGVATILKFTINFAIKHKLKLKIAARNSLKNFSAERNFYEKYLNNKEYNYLVKNIIYRSDKYNTYIGMEKSKVVIGTMSTMLRENLAINGKTLACNFMKTSIFDFPIKGICFFNESNYIKFEKRLKNILQISQHNYKKLLKKNISYIVHKEKNLNTIDQIKFILKLFLK